MANRQKLPVIVALDPLAAVSIDPICEISS